MKKYTPNQPIQCQQVQTYDWHSSFPWVSTPYHMISHSQQDASKSASCFSLALSLMQNSALAPYHTQNHVTICSHAKSNHLASAWSYLTDPYRNHRCDQSQSRPTNPTGLHPSQLRPNPNSSRMATTWPWDLEACQCDMALM